jgi:hypothetical protein
MSHRIGGGFDVNVLPRYSEPTEPIYGFKTREEANAFIGKRPRLSQNREVQETSGVTSHER